MAVSGKQVTLADASLFEGGEHLVLSTASEAADQDASAVVGLTDVQVRGLAVVVGGTEGPILAPGVGASCDL